MDSRLSFLETSLRKLLVDSKTFEDFCQYFCALRDWVIATCGDRLVEMAEIPDFEGLIGIDCDDYLVSDHGLCLEREEKRILGSEKSSVGSLLRGVNETLWDLVTVVSDRTCPACGCPGLRCLFYASRVTSDRELVLECGTCGYCEFVGGAVVDPTTAIILPASRREIDAIVKSRS